MHRRRSLQPRPVQSPMDNLGGYGSQSKKQNQSLGNSGLGQSLRRHRGWWGCESFFCHPAEVSLKTYIDPGNRLTDEEFLAYLLSRAGTHRNGEIRVDLQQPFASGAVCRQSIDPSSWTWKVLLAYKWRNDSSHINVLETVAVLDLSRKLAKVIRNFMSESSSYLWTTKWLWECCPRDGPLLELCKCL